MPTVEELAAPLARICCTFTSGARAQSAASALNNAGATVVAILAIGRVISIDAGEHTEQYWQRQKQTPFDFNACCVSPHRSL